MLLFQRVLFLLRGAPSEVNLRICRPGPGVLYDIDDNTLVSPHAHYRTHIYLHIEKNTKLLNWTQ